MPEEEIITLEDWEKFAFAIDPTSLFDNYIRRNGIPIDVLTAPDAAGNSLSTLIRKDLGLWMPTDYIDKHRSRKDAGKFEIRKDFDPEIVGGKVVGICDDWALTCGTLIEGIESADDGGATEIHAFLVHGEFVDDAFERLIQIKLKNAKDLQIHTTDTVDNPAAKISTVAEVAERLYSVPMRLNY